MSSLKKGHYQTIFPDESTSSGPSLIPPNRNSQHECIRIPMYHGATLPLLFILVLWLLISSSQRTSNQFWSLVLAVVLRTWLSNIQGFFLTFILLQLLSKTFLELITISMLSGSILYSSSVENSRFFPSLHFKVCPSVAKSSNWKFYGSMNNHWTFASLSLFQSSLYSIRAITSHLE